MIQAPPVPSAPSSRSWGIALGVFVLAAVLAAALIWRLEQSRLGAARALVYNLASERANAIQVNIDHAFSATYALAAMVRQGNGNVPDFSATATQMLPFYPGIASLQLLPGGIVAEVVPLAGNEKAIGHNVLTDPTRNKEAILARDTGAMTLAGPFTLKQGGLGAVGRLPVFLNTEQGGASFWGFIAILIRFPEILVTAQLPSLVERGFGYELWRIHPDTGQKQIIGTSSSTPLIDPVERELKVPNATWTLSISPVAGWGDVTSVLFKVALGLVFSLLLAWLAKLLVDARAQERMLEARVALRTQDLQRFSEVTAHHLQEPARRMASYAERLTTQLVGYTLDAETQLSLGFIGQQARRMLHLLGAVELYLAADQARGQLDKTQVGPVVAKVLGRMSRHILATRTTVTVGALPAAWIDAPRLADLFEIVLENALRHGACNNPATPLCITIDGERQGKFVRLRVSDNGPGIDEQYRERVFGVFERLASGGEGTGIGLAIVRRIAESCAGRAWIEEAPGGGCRVLFELPAEATS